MNNYYDLKINDVSNIKSTQIKLKELGFYQGSIRENYGYDTTIAIEEFQKTYHLPILGYSDERTIEALNEEVNAIARPRYSESVLDRPTLKYGDSGEYVTLLQKQLKTLMFYNGEIDGIFGNTTLGSVKAFQVNNKLTADGVVGTDTWSSLIYLYSPLAVCGSNIYIVQKGDTLYSIAKKYSTTVSELISLNNLASTALSIGQELIVPSTTTTTNLVTYTVVKGDTLYSIAKKYGITVSTIKTQNNLTTDTLSIGQQLVIPQTDNLITYTVVKGDTLWSIAKAYNTTVDSIKSLNNLTTNSLSIGQQLLIKKV